MLINFGPIQAFFSRKWGLKKVDTPKQGSGKVIEEELYWRNRASRSFARMVDEDDHLLAGDRGAEGKRVVGKDHEVVDGDQGDTGDGVNEGRTPCSRNRGRRTSRYPSEFDHVVVENLEQPLSPRVWVDRRDLVGK